ncbi:MAG: VWA domain-containing protein [Bacteroidota bacterium]
MDRFQKWRLILGKKADPESQVGLSAAQAGMDNVLEALYDSERKGGLGASSPNVNRWLGDIRKYFPSSTVQVMQKDALERLDLKKILTQPELLEMMEPDVNLVATLISLNKAMPTKTRETAKVIVKKVVKDLEKRLRAPLRQAITGALNRSARNRRPKHNEIDWNRTVRINLKNYQKEYNTIIPEILIGHARKSQSLKEVILLMDQSGSMASSVVYASIFGSVMASMRSLKTHFIAFDTQVANLSAEMDDPIDLLFGVQLGGGTDINQAVGYAQKIISVPMDTILILITDLYEGGNQGQLLKKAASLKASGVQFIVLLALDDQGSPAFDRSLAAKFATMNIPAFACSPDRFPALMEAAIKGSGMDKLIHAPASALQ